jgi:hypothetical protein
VRIAHIGIACLVSLDGTHERSPKTLCGLPVALTVPATETAELCRACLDRHRGSPRLYIPMVEIGPTVLRHREVRS